jgi:CheY-like chemotaxis protein
MDSDNEDLKKPSLQRGGRMYHGGALAEGEGALLMPVLSQTTVLVLDDNPLVLKLGRALLEREGCTVLTASSWIEFNHVLAGNTPDIIFLDVNLPSIKGNRLSEVLKSQSNKKDIPIVLISDLPEKSLEEMFPSSGANAWMRKPLTRDKLLDMINRHVSPV